MSIAPTEPPKPPSFRRATATTPQPPPAEVVAAIESGVVRVTRRVAVFESDGETLWNPDPTDDPEFARLVDGNVSVDYSSAERRKLDLVLDNRDQLLRPNPNGGFWYDKIIKVYRGVEYNGSTVAPRAAIIESPSHTEAMQLRAQVSSFGFDRTDYMPTVIQSNELKDYTYVLAYTKSAATTRAGLLEELWEAGKNVVTVGAGNTLNEIPFYTAVSVSGSYPFGVEPVAGDSPTAGAFTTQGIGTATGTRVTGLAAGSQRLSVWDAAGANSNITASIATSPKGGYWLDLHLPEFDAPQVQALMRAALNFMRGYYSDLAWETQIGEFMIDNLSNDYFPDQIKVTGRDYAKKLMNSKISQSTTFVAGTKLRDVVKAVAINGGVNPNKMRVGIGDEVLASDMAFERGTDRWSVVKSACDSYDYEVYFDAFGYFVVRSYLDPTTSPTAWTFKTGLEEDPDGANLVSYSRSTNDSRIYNKVAVFGDPADSEERLPYFGEASNTDPASPTNISRLGERLLVIETNWLGSDAECQQLAEDRLKIVALESYEINFSSIYYAWLEVGEIAEVLDPDRLDFEPTRFLMDTISLPLGLGPMSATGKRVTFVGSSGSPGEVLEGA